MNLDAMLDDEELITILPAALPGCDEGATVSIRYVPQETLRKIHRKSLHKDATGKEVLDTDKANRLLGRTAVAGWTGFPTYHGEPLAYSPEVCDRLINKWGDFSRFVNDACLDYARLVDAQRDDSKKNSALMSSSD